MKTDLQPNSRVGQMSAHKSDNQFLMVHTLRHVAYLLCKNKKTKKQKS